MRNIVNETLLLDVSHDTGGEILILKSLSRQYKIHDPRVFTW